MVTIRNTYTSNDESEWVTGDEPLVTVIAAGSDNQFSGNITVSYEDCDVSTSFNFKRLGGLEFTGFNIEHGEPTHSTDFIDQYANALTLLAKITLRLKQSGISGSRMTWTREATKVAGEILEMWRQGRG
jgi:hypothetical protein